VNEENKEQRRPRASIRGKGHEILLGKRAQQPLERDDAVDTPATEQPENVDAEALVLTPEETEALLDFSPASPAYESQVEVDLGQDADELAWLAGPEPAPAPTPPHDAADALPLAERPAEDIAARLYDAYHPRPEVERLAPSAPEHWDTDARVDVGDAPGGEPAAADDLYISEARSAPPDAGDALPLAERISGEIMEALQDRYRPHRDVEQITPQDPEVWQWEGVRSAPDDQFFQAAPVESKEALFEEHEGGLMAPGNVLAGIDDDFDGLEDPFASAARPPADALFDDTAPADPELLDKLVDDERVQKLWLQIEALQEELASSTYTSREDADIYHQELLQASSLLLGRRANYDDARAIVYRVRADMNRQRKVNADIRRYRPLLLNYYVGWGIALVVLVFLQDLFGGVAEAVGIEVFTSFYYPILFGVLGALISGYITLDRHTTKQRDFDPIHITWYLFNPLLGGVMGLLMYLLAAIANSDLLYDTASDPELAIAWILCVVAGMNQNTVLRQMNDLLGRFGGDDEDDNTTSTNNSGSAGA
jgi:hypothetical protein